MSEIRAGPGEKLAGYEIVTALPARGAGPSYRAIDPQTSRPVMIRALSPLDGRDPKTFELEASRLVKLRHPGIVSLLDYGVEHGVPFVVTELVEAESLAALLSRGELRPADSLAILRQAAAAIDYAHAAGVVHGDLQLQGVLIDGEHHPHIQDFGFRQLSGTEGDAPSGGIAYRAPEQLQTGRPGAPADRYSFAAIASVLVEHVADPDSATAAAIDAVISKGLDQDPTRRWLSCTAMVDALDRALEPPAIPAAARKSGAGVWIALAAAAGIAVLAVLLLVNKPAATPSPPPNATLTLSRSTILPGATLVVSGAHLPANQAGTIELESKPQQIGTFTADPTGTFSATVTVPDGTSQGDHLISACWDNTCPARSTVTVLAPSPSPSPSSPPPTPTPSASPSPTALASPSASTSP